MNTVAAPVLLRRFHQASYRSCVVPLLLLRSPTARATHTCATLQARRKLEQAVPTSEERLFNLKSAEKRYGYIYTCTINAS